MKNNLELYNKTVDILFNAYFNDTLEVGSQCACAVGNIISANSGKKIIGSWYGCFRRRRQMGPLELVNRNYSDGLEEIESTGYSIGEIIKIEYAFESGGRTGSTDEDNMFNGLCAVLEVLKEIHGIKEDEHTTQVSRFQNHYATK